MIYSLVQIKGFKNPQVVLAGEVNKLTSEYEVLFTGNYTEMDEHLDSMATKVKEPTKKGECHHCAYYYVVPQDEPCESCVHFDGFQRGIGNAE